MNEEQIAYWNGPAAARWTAQQQVLDRALEPFSAAALRLAAAVGGEHALDVGCGCGDTALALAERVGAQGRVLGIDVSGPMLARAKERAAGLSQLEFTQADAATVRFTPDNDLLFSRFGVMFFEEPISAFANLRRALRPSGRVAFVCWRAFADNPWATLPVAVVERVLQQTDPWKSDAPGPYAFADLDKLDRILREAGFHSVEITRFDARLIPPRSDLEGTVDFLINSGPAARLLSGAAPELAARAREELARALAAQGDLALIGSSWLVQARAST